MGLIKQNLVFAIAILGGVSASQMPEFAQQYRQRIGGVIEELERTVSEFDRSAATSGMSRQQALDLHAQAKEPLFGAEGRSIQTAIARLERLVRQQADFAERSPLLQPIMLASADRTTLVGAWRDFVPAVPVTIAGLAWGAAGFLVAAFLVHLLAAVSSWIWRSCNSHRRRARQSKASSTPKY